MVRASSYVEIITDVFISNYTAIAVAVQFISDEIVAMFELVMQEGSIKVAKEQHYQLVQSSDITDGDRAIYVRAAHGFHAE